MTGVNTFCLRVLAPTSEQVCCRHRGHHRHQAAVMKTLDLLVVAAVLLAGACVICNLCWGAICAQVGWMSANVKLGGTRNLQEDAPPLDAID